jgi:LysM repeat protein
MVENTIQYEHLKVSYDDKKHSFVIDSKEIDDSKSEPDWKIYYINPVYVTNILYDAPRSWAGEGSGYGVGSIRVGSNDHYLDMAYPLDPDNKAKRKYVYCSVWVNGASDELANQLKLAFLHLAPIVLDEMPADSVGRQVTGNTTYIGEFKHGKPNGQGVEVSIYGIDTITNSGHWAAGKMSGYGTSIAKIGSSISNIYRGEFLNGESTGYGVRTITDADHGNNIVNKYSGEWLKGRREGQGIIEEYKRSALSFSYKGSFKNHQYSGHGVLKEGNGDVYDGEWSEDKRNGYGTQTHKNGKIEKGTWKDDVLMQHDVSKSIKYHAVNEGETLAGIAKASNVSMEQIKMWNNLRDATISPGQVLIVNK